jgi:hypothetical protein
MHAGLGGGHAWHGGAHAGLGGGQAGHNGAHAGLVGGHAEHEPGHSERGFGHATREPDIARAAISGVRPKRGGARKAGGRRARAGSLRAGRRGTVRRRFARRRPPIGRAVRGRIRRTDARPSAAGAWRLAVIVTACNEAATIGGVIREAQALRPDELIVVLNGCTDRSLAVVRAFPGVTILHYPEPLGHDVGRAAGAAMADADVCLFLDGDLAIPARALMPFVDAVRRGADVALNGLDRHLGPFSRWDDVTRMKAFLNRALGRPDLGAASMTAVPHALSRRAIGRIGTAALAVPPKAQALAIASGLDVRIGGSVDVIRRNRQREANTGKANPVSRMIVGDHIEALRAVMDMTGPRLKFPDASRRRDAARGESLCDTG